MLRASDEDVRPGTPPAPAEEFLTRHPFIRFRANVPLAHLIDLELARLNLPLREIAQIETASAITACIANGLGVSIVPQVAITDCATELVKAPFGKRQLHRKIGLAERNTAPRASLISMLHQLLAEESGPHGIYSDGS